MMKRQGDCTLEKNLGLIDGYQIKTDSIAKAETRTKASIAGAPLATKYRKS